MTPLVSVVIPFLNADRFLAGAMDSVTAQTYQNCEVILIDDGSTDESGSLAARYVEERTNVRCFCHEGHRHSWNFGEPQPRAQARERRIRRAA
jgi:glycosyltransferase involved in cell wall biosynthesis